MAELPGGSHSKLLFYDEALLVLGSEKVSKYYRHVMYVLDLDLNVTGRYILSADVEADSHFTIGNASIENDVLYVAGTNMRPGNAQWAIYAVALKPQPEVRTVTETVTVTATVTWTETITRIKTYTETETRTLVLTTSITETLTTTLEHTRTITQRETITVTQRETETIKAVETREIVRETKETITVTQEVIPGTPIAAALAALIVLAIALLIALRGIRRAF